MLSVFILFKIMAPEECSVIRLSVISCYLLLWPEHVNLSASCNMQLFLALSNFMFFLMIGHLLTDVSSLLLARGVNLNDNCICSPEMKG